MMNLSKHFTLDEMLKSPTAQRLGIDNTPNAEQLENLRDLVEFVLEPLRHKFAQPIIITSAFRCAKLNKAVGGSPTSQHVKGQAADIRTVSDKFADNKELFDILIESDIPYDQVIFEYGNDVGPDWIHVSYRPNGRRQVLRAVKKNGKTVYQQVK